MNAVIRAATIDDVESICTLLHTKMNSRIPVSRWRNLMTYPWLAEKPDYGRIVESEAGILGFCGMVYSDRLIGDGKVGDTKNGLRSERMVSMSSWYLDKSLRGQGLGRDMLLDAVKDKSMSYATLTNSKKPLGIVESLGFRVLENARYVWQRSSANVSPITVSTDASEMYSQLEPYQQTLMDDMQAQPLTPVLLQQGEQQALLFFSVTSKGENVTWYDLMYASDLDLFAEHSQGLANALLPDGCAKLSADSRFVQHPDSHGVAEDLPVSRYYISQRVEPQEIDHLYSELQLLDLKLD